MGNEERREGEKVGCANMKIEDVPMGAVYMINGVLLSEGEFKVPLAKEVVRSVFKVGMFSLPTPMLKLWLVF